MADPFAQMVKTINKKPNEGALSVCFTIRITERQRLFIVENGGHDYVRAMLNEAMAKQEVEE